MHWPMMDLATSLTPRSASALKNVASPEVFFSSFVLQYVYIYTYVCMTF